MNNTTQDTKPTCQKCGSYSGYDENGRANDYCMTCDPLPTPIIKPVRTA